MSQINSQSKTAEVIEKYREIERERKAQVIQSSYNLSLVQSSRRTVLRTVGESFIVVSERESVCVREEQKKRGGVSLGSSCSFRVVN